MKYLIFVICLILIHCSFISAQESFVIGNRYTLRSEVLNEDRTFCVSLPPSYNNDKLAKASYPVIWLIDGQMYFQSVVAVQQFLNRGLYARVPEAIVVGIYNTNRSRDLTPTRGYVIHKGDTIYSESGGADQFIQFITNELRPYIQKNFRTNGYNVLVGHSFGGLFTLHALINHTQQFNAYVALDPSLWWNNRATFNELNRKWSQANFKNINLFVAMAHNENEVGDELQHSALIRRFCTETLPLESSSGLRRQWRYYANEDHGTIVMPAVFDAMRWLYDGICLPVKQIPLQPELVQQHYNLVADSLGFVLLPNELLIQDIAQYCISRNKTESALTLLRMNTTNYPTSVQAHLALANACQKAGLTDEAKLHAVEAMALCPSLTDSINRNILNINVNNNIKYKTNEH